ncbi:MAG: methyltransferase domain-containing protein [Nanoarchaeota archaeon]|nr:methyltransferase domain-containing protein [Nanoarchaeota archaeon]
MKVKLNLGCGTDHMKGWLNVDYKDLPEVDKVMDLNKFPYDFKSNSVDYIYMDHVLAHLKYPNKTIKECHRILKKGGILEIKVPHFSCHTAYLGELRPHIYSYNAFYRFSPKHPRSYYFDYHYSKVDIKFNFQKKPFFLFWINYLVEWIANKKYYLYENTALRVFPCTELIVKMKK